MKNYLKEKNALSLPWIESPFFYEILENSSMSNEQKEVCKKFHEDGYIIIDLDLKDADVEQVISDMHTSLESDSTNYHAEHFQYTEKRRIFELWKQSKASAEMCLNGTIIETLQKLYNKTPVPFSTINFFAGSNQPLHSDVIHFHTVPAKWMVGVWVALEDVDETNGSLKVIPGSHKWNLWEYEDLLFPHPDDVENGEEVLYRQYEDFLKQLTSVKGVDPHIARLKKGQALIWSANLLHGGCNIPGVTDFSKSRYIQVQHYFFEGCDIHYHPMFSRKSKGVYAKKWCSDDNNIQTYLEKGEVNISGEVIKVKDYSIKENQ